MPSKPQLPSRAAGFRFSPADAAAIVLGAGATGLLWRPLGRVALLFPVALGHFFLFCNVFRLRRSLELTWAALFVLNILIDVFRNASSGNSVEIIDWRIVLTVQAPLTLAVVLVEMCTARYHGVGWKWINPTYAPPVKEPP